MCTPSPSTCPAGRTTRRTPATPATPAAPATFDGRSGTGSGSPSPTGLACCAACCPRTTATLEAAARRLARDPRHVQPLLCAWFGDERRLRGRPARPWATAAQALLHTHRGLAVDDLAEALVAAAHPRADELLAVLAEDEPSALCRAVHRWAHDERPGRRARPAAAYGHVTAPHVRTPADRELLRQAAQALLARPGDSTLHGGALAHAAPRPPGARADTCPRPWPASGARSAAPGSPPRPWWPPCRYCPSRTRCSQPCAPGPTGGAARPGRAHHSGTGPASAVTSYGTTWRGARRTPARRPPSWTGAWSRARRPAPVLRPLVMELLRPRDVGPAALAAVLAAPGGEPSYPCVASLADVLLREESDPAVLDAFLGAVAAGAGGRPHQRTPGPAQTNRPAAAPSPRRTRAVRAA
ncbi:hypothetical protein ACFSNO_17875, partial [Streptomyces cirratus]